MQQLQLTIDQDSQLLNELVSAVRSPTLSRSAKLAEIGRILAHFDLPIEAPRVAGQLWSATDLGKELGVSAQAIGRLANQHQLIRPAFGEYLERYRAKAKVCGFAGHLAAAEAMG